MDDVKLPEFLGPKGIERFRKKRRYLVLDFETSILPGFATNPEQKLVLACWYIVDRGRVTKRHKFGDEYEQQELLDDIHTVDFVVAHNAKFEAQWLQRCGLDLHDVLFFCTMVGEWIILGNNPGRLPTNLDDIAARRLGGEKDQLGKNLIKEWKVCPSLTPESWLKDYCYKDVDLTHGIFLQQVEELEALEMWHIALCRMLVVPVLADMELQGLQLDKEKVYEEFEKQMSVREESAEALDAITGGINLNSGPQLGVVLYDELGFAEVVDYKGNTVKTPGGARSTSEDTIMSLKPETELQEEFLRRYKEYSKANTLLTKTLTFLKLVVDHNDGVFYGSIIQGRTGTHRLASGGVDVFFPGEKKARKIQLQNIPRQYKKMFTAHDPDWVVLEGDGAQLEFRVAAELGNDTQALSDIENGEDIHSATREVMREAKHPAFDGLSDKEGRQVAKAFTFQPLYGGRGSHPAENAYADFWAKKYSGIFREQTTWCARVSSDKKLTTPYGMTFYWPNVKVYYDGRVNVTTEVFNYPIQGFATAEIIPIALVYFWHRSRNLRLQLFNTVHDSIISRVHKDDLEQAEALTKQCLTYDVYQFLRDVYSYEFTVPLGVGMKSSRHWGAGDIEKVWDVWPDGRERYQEKD